MRLRVRVVLVFRCIAGCLCSLASTRLPIYKHERVNNCVERKNPISKNSEFCHHSTNIEFFNKDWAVKGPRASLEP